MSFDDLRTVLTPEMITLHRYYVHANRLSHYFRSTLANPEWLEFVKLVPSEHQPIAANFAFMLHDPGIFMSYWYGSLYVVVEGWEKLKLSDQTVDKLLESPNVDLLRRFRNGVFHFQKDYFNDRMTDFISAESTVPWVHDLTNAIGAFFRKLAGDTWPEVTPEFEQKFRDIKPTDAQMLEMLGQLQSLIAGVEPRSSVSPNENEGPASAS